MADEPIIDLQSDHYFMGEALRQAALKLMADPRYRHPFYWSGFMVVGKGM